jgi:hypothetical protein
VRTKKSLNNWFWSPLKRILQIDIKVNWRFQFHFRKWYFAQYLLQRSSTSYSENLFFRNLFFRNLFFSNLYFRNLFSETSISETFFQKPFFRNHTEKRQIVAPAPPQCRSVWPEMFWKIVKRAPKQSHNSKPHLGNFVLFYIYLIFEGLKFLAYF